MERREERKVKTSKEEAKIDVMRNEASNEGENKALWRDINEEREGRIKNEWRNEGRNKCGREGR